MTTLLSTPWAFLKAIFTHLWLSISSVNFYTKVYKNYKGYGAKYIFTLSLMSAFMCTIIFLNHANKIRNYFKEDIISNPYIENIDHVIGQVPEISYDGSVISLQEQSPMILYNIHENKVLALDPDNKMKPSDRAKMPLMVTSDKMIINLLNEEGRVYYAFPVEYTEIFGDYPKILTQEIIKSSFANIFDQTPWLFIYLLFPMLTILIFINVILEKSFIILIVYMMTLLSGVKTSVKTSVRMVFFASGVFVLLQFFILLALPFLKTTLWMLQIWANFLMIMGIMQASGRNYSWFKRK